MRIKKNNTTDFICSAFVAAWKGLSGLWMVVILALAGHGSSYGQCALTLGADSLDAVELIMAIEEAFDIEIPDEEAETMTTPADCVTAIKAKL